ncbi:MAG: hypothetical protein UY50_C0031G0017 [Parcubacteria group bacterium GW2011_GWA2_49_9]|nr:MAG: hypothetical protein UY50_C0031G0017 [Parcubacteria group bacterium GW2011_GWA2_49_9]
MDSRVIYPELSYTLTGICFVAHDEVGLYGKEKHYCDIVARELAVKKIPHEREVTIADTGNRVDFIVDGKILLECKSKRMLTKEDYAQTQRYLQITGLKLGLLVNFRDKYVKPERIVRIDTDRAQKYRM